MSSAAIFPSSFQLPSDTSLPPIETTVAATVPADEPAPIVQGPFHYIQRYQRQHFEQMPKKECVPVTTNIAKYEVVYDPYFEEACLAAVEPYNAALVENLISENPYNFFYYQMKRVLIKALEADASPEHIKFLIGNIKTKKNFIDLGGDESPLKLAFEKDRGDVVQLLLEYGTSFENTFPNTCEGNIFLSAASNGKLSIVQFFQKIGFPLNYHDVVKVHLGNTALHWAALCKHEKVIAFLLEKGADPLAVNGDGDTYVQHAKRMHNKFNEVAVNALMLKLTQGKDPAWGIQGLLEDIIDVDAPVDQRKNTLLHLALKIHWDSLEELLLQKNASLSIPNDRGITAFEYKLRDSLSLNDPWMADECQKLAEKHHIDIKACEERIQERDCTARQMILEALKGERELNEEEINDYCEDLLNINRPDSEGNTLLHLAYKWLPDNVPRKSIKEALIKNAYAGCFAQLNNNGQGPLDCSYKVHPKKEDVESIEHLKLDKKNLPSFDYHDLHLYTSLKSIKIKPVDHYQLNFKEFIECVATQCPQLESLRIRSYSVDALSLKSLLQNCRQLSTLIMPVRGDEDAVRALTTSKLYNFQCLGLNGLKSNCLPLFERLLDLNPHLLKLQLRGSEISDSTLESIKNFIPHLQGLDLRGCKNITENAVTGVTEVCNQLRELRFDANVIHKDNLLEIIDNCPHLEVLHFKYPGDSIYPEHDRKKWYEHLIDKCHLFNTLIVINNNENNFELNAGLTYLRKHVKSVINKRY